MSLKVLIFLHKKGSYSYTDANGELVEVKYTAGKDGFKVLNEKKPEQPRASSSNKQSNLDWIQSIKARTTRRPPTTTILSLVEWLSQSFERKPSCFQRKSFCFHRAFNESHPVFKELSTKDILILLL